jgi:YidC/Oxa1 family membrane protein insertase
MFSFIWHSIFFDPVYNTLVLFIDIVRGGDVGIAIILTVIVVKLLLLPISLKAARTQLAMRELEPKIQELKEKYKDKREEQAMRMVELFREAKVNPFSSILLLFIQIPIVIALYLSVSTGGGIALPKINTELLYPFIPTPESPNMFFLGVLDIAGKSFPLAFIAGVLQYLHTHLAIPKLPPRDPKAPVSFKDDFSRSFQLQMRYILPVIIFIASYSISAAIALYFVVSNLTAIAQEFIVRRNGLKK